MNKITGTLLIIVLVLAACGGGADDPALEGLPLVPSPTAGVEFVSPQDGETVSNPVRLEMRAEGVTIEPAASGVRENAGHLHVMVDAGCVDEGEVIPADESHFHYGMGQTEAEVTLEPGDRELCLQVADGDHVALPITSTINITVE